MPQNPGPHGFDGSDGVVNIIAHELAETVTDPLANGWKLTNGEENADVSSIAGASVWVFFVRAGYTVYLKCVICVLY